MIAQTGARNKTNSQLQTKIEKRPPTRPLTFASQLASAKSLKMLANQATERIRNKYNTLTPAEAKKLNRLLTTQSVGVSDISSISHHQAGTYNNQQVHLRQLPVRTASVLHKPRAPPIVVANLDTTVEQLTQSYDVNNYASNNSTRGTSDITDSKPPETNLNRSSSIRSVSNAFISSSGRDNRRHTMNYGRASTLNSRTSLHSNVTSLSNQHNSNHCNQDYGCHPQQQSPLGESISNLSFKSSLDTHTDLAHDPYQQQTMSVNMGSQYIAQQQPLAFKSHHESTIRNRAVIRLKYNTMNSTRSRIFSDESYSSSKSEIFFDSSTGLTPTKPGTKTSATRLGILNTPRSGSKTSLSSSTYKVFQSPLANLKKLFRNMPRPFSTASQYDQAKSNDKSAANAYSNPGMLQSHLDSSCQSDSTMINDISISDSISQFNLNKSQSPPVCPPPPSELKSMCYMENTAVNYSNYDEFTRARNEQMARHQVEKSKQSGFAPAGQHCEESRPSTNDTDGDSWHLMSLPVYYERNLTTVFEEKQASCELVDKSAKSKVSPANDCSSLIKPPSNFADYVRQSELNTSYLRQSGEIKVISNPSRSSTSPSSPDSVLDSRQHSAQTAVTMDPATPYRFSFAQPTQLMTTDQVNAPRNLGLPPRMPVSSFAANSETHSGSTGNQRQDNSSSGNSSNCSSQFNEINHCDRPNSLETTSDDKNSYVSEEYASYGNLNGLSNDPDVTILSETSTLQGELSVAYYANKCNELERTVATLKNKLIGKERELTDLQLNQLNIDYALERLRKQVSKLERENAHLKTMVVKG